MIQIVIKIPEDEYNIAKYGQCGNINVDIVRKALANGTPLPERHGRLIDADELYGDFIDGTEGYDCNTWNRIEIGDIIDNALTIIEGSESE